MKDDWVPIEFPQAEIEEKFAEWAGSKLESVGFCFLCGNQIATEQDFIPGTNTHNCKEGQEFEARIRREQWLRCNRK
jgi:hypothetical protein